MKIKLNGKRELEAALKRVVTNHRKAVNDEIAKACLRTVADAKIRLQPEQWDTPKTIQDVVDVRQSINFNHDRNTFHASVHAGNTGDPIAAYLEFGTGPYAARYTARLNPEIARYAMTFYVNGKGRTSEHPYLIPSWLENSQKLSEKLRGLKPGWK